MKFESRSRYHIHRSAVLLDGYSGAGGVLLQIRKGPIRRVKINYAATKVLRLLHNGMTWFEIEKILNLSADRTKRIMDEFLLPLLEFGIIEPTTNLSNPFQIKRRDYPSALRRIFIEVTGRCNLLCSHCYLSRSKASNDDLSFEMISEIIEQAHDLGVVQVDVTGGEPTIRSDIHDILYCLTKFGMVINLYTNGTLLNEDFCKKLEDYRIGHIIVSLDGMDAQTHDTFRGGNGAYERTVTSLRMLAKGNLNVRVNVTCFEENRDQVLDIVRFAYEDIKAESVVVAPILQAGRGRKSYNRNIVPDAVPPLQAMAYRNVDPMKFCYSESLSNVKGPYCGVGQSMLHIDSDGMVHLCPTLTEFENPLFKLGDLKTESLWTIWERAVKRVEGWNFQCRLVTSCPYASICRGGCRSRAYLNYGDLTAPDEVMCNFFKYLDSTRETRGNDSR